MKDLYLLFEKRLFRHQNLKILKQCLSQ